MKSLKARAVDLRHRGWSYNVIAQRLGVSKSTLSHWLREVPYEPNRTIIKRIRLGPARAAASKQRRRLQEIHTFKSDGRRDLGAISPRDLWLLGLGLYIGEGTKLSEDVRIVNADPRVIRVAMEWLRKSCGIATRHFAILIHAYPNNSPAACIRYWSGVTGVPPRQFEKMQIDRRLNKSHKKHRQLPYGTAHIKIYSRGDRRFGVALHRRMMGWIEAAYEQLRA